MGEINLQDHVVEINGHTVDGWSDDSDALMLPQEIEMITTKTGASGHMTAFRTGERGGEVSLKLMPDSPSTKQFLRWTERVRKGEPIRFDMDIENTHRGYTISCKAGVFTKSPFGPSVGKGEAANPVFTLMFEDISLNYDAADFVTAV